MAVEYKLPILQGIFATGCISWLAWLSIAHIETDRTQDVVLERMMSVEEDYTELHRVINLLPAKTADRWHKSEEMLYQGGMEGRVHRLELFHEPYMWEKGGQFEQ